MDKEEKIIRNSKNRFELEGNIANFNDVFITSNGKKRLRFDLGQNNGDNSRFIPIVLNGELANSYGKEIKKGNWVTIKGRIFSYQKEIKKDDKTLKNKVIEIHGFEVIDRSNKKIYLSDGKTKEIVNNKENKER